MWMFDKEKKIDIKVRRIIVRWKEAEARAYDITGSLLGVLHQRNRYRNPWTARISTASLSRKLKLRLFCANSHPIIDLASVGRSLLLSLLHCLHLPFSDYGKPATACEVQLWFRRANSFWKEHIKGKRGLWLSDIFRQLWTFVKKSFIFFLLFRKRGQV